MKLNDALQAIASARERPPGPPLWLVCGFEPLHLKTFLHAAYVQRQTERRLIIETGLFGDLEGNLDRAADAKAEACAIVIEWGDLDPRLGLRSCGPWSGRRQEQILIDVEHRLQRLRIGIERVVAKGAVAISAPTIPFPLGGSTPFVQQSAFELSLQRGLSQFFADIAALPRTLVLHPNKLDEISLATERHDARMELTVGFPYRLTHASVLAELLIQLLFATAPKKALITDLDDTLWRGLIGEVGADQVTWTQEHHAQVHGLYQSMLQQLADSGVLLGVASKNDPDVARAGLARADLWVSGETFFPVHANWEAKSRAVGAILETWNIGPQAVVFVDDNPMELDEVGRVHPEVTCLLFPGKDPAKLLRFLVTLRDLFGTSVATEEDALRGPSMRAAAAFTRDRSHVDDDRGFLEALDGELTFRRDHSVDATRALQLINKTNQFNLNGERISEGELRQHIEAHDHFLVMAAYSDRYGPLGNIGVVAGRIEANRIHVSHWVLSCRAFSRNIEHHMLQQILVLAEGRPVYLDYKATPRNGPLQTFLQTLAIDLSTGREVLLDIDVGARLESFLLHTLVPSHHA